MSIDKRDQKIIRELDLDPKISTSQLAKKVRLSQQVVDYRIKKLQERKAISQFGTIVNFAKLGYAEYRVLFTLHNVDAPQKKELLDFLQQHNRIYWAALVGSKWDLVVVLLVKEYAEFEEFLEDLFSEFPKVMKDYLALYTLQHDFYNHRFLYNIRNSTQQISVDYAKDDTTQLTSLQHCILKQITNNCRIASLEVASKCNTSYKTVQSRVQELKERKVIQGHRLFLNSENYGFSPYFLLLSFDNYGREVEKDLIAFAKEHSHITQTIKLFGSWSIMFHIRVKEFKDVQEIIVEMRNKYPIIGDYEIIPIFEDIRINLFPINPSP